MGPSPALGTSTHTRALRILLADDNRDAVFLLQRLLHLKGYQVHGVFDGIEAVASVGTFHPDVVLLDIGMPRMNGFDAARHIRQQPGGADITLIAITGWGQPEDRERTSEAGFDHHFTKPVDPKTLLAILADLPIR